ncbi:uncharacterized protein LOC128225672 [Mya arenaria]|uniref:uncharacterized protein LOC128225672 n=1 Tax=Mya arenaria TaxID=6604 RepID=UPI0022DEFA51|nr:uncharacterized protein LOC128225672 [Mya arenaria]
MESQEESHLSDLVNVQRQRPDDPADLEFQLEREFIGEEFILDDIRVDGQRHIIFATQQQLHHLRQSRRWFIDGTFKLVKHPFYQLATIHCFVKKGEDTKQVPLVYVLMSRRTKHDYIEVLRSLLRHIGQPLVEWFMLDFEAATWQAIREVFSEHLLTRIQRKKYASIHGRLFDAWDHYEEDELTTIVQLLRTISNIAGLGPTNPSDDVHDGDMTN